MIKGGDEDVAIPGTPIVMDWVRRQAGITSYGRDQVIFYRGHRPMVLHVILEGSVALQGEGAQGSGDEMISVGAGWVLGLRGLMSGRPYPVSAVALEECRVALIDKTAFELAIAADDAPLRDLIGATGGTVL